MDRNYKNEKSLFCFTKPTKNYLTKNSKHENTFVRKY